MLRSASYTFNSYGDRVKDEKKTIGGILCRDKRDWLSILRPTERENNTVCSCYIFVKHRFSVVFEI